MSKPAESGRFCLRNEKEGYIFRSQITGLGQFGTCHILGLRFGTCSEPHLVPNLEVRTPTLMWLSTETRFSIRSEFENSTDLPHH
jgi:hypothetical protein